ncbi:MAG: type V CRISPR-associated protein Cas12a/Cpf1 [Candidatus Cryptobacteroides sp.]
MEFNDFVGLYNLSKTLRFEAIPVGATRTNIYEGSLLKDDEHRAESYQIVKKLIDEYHKDYIDRTLTGFQFDVNDLSHYRELYSQKASDLRKKDEFEKLQVKLRGDVSSALKNTAEFKRICKKELIREDLFQFFVKAGPDQLCGLSRDEADKVVLEFRDFTTYFTGFHQNRANIYTSEEHSTGIPYRLINDNLPRFLDNMEVFERIMEIPEFKDCLEQLFEDFKQYLDVDDLAKVFELKYYNMVLTQIKIDLYNSIIGGRTEKNSDKKIQGLNEYINLYNQRHSTAKLPKFKTLYKQILSDRVAVSWLPEEFESDQELIDAIRNCYETLQNTVLCENGLKHLLESIDSFNLDGIFIKNDSQLSEISQRHYKDWGLIQAAIKTAFLKEGILKRKKAESEEEFQKRSSSLFKRSECFSIAYIDNCVKALNPDVNGSIADYFRNLNASNDESYVSGNVFCRIEDAYLQVADLLNNPYPNDKNLCQNPDQVELIKALLDSLKDLQRFVKPLIGAVSESGKDERFYGELFPLWAELDIVSHLYDKVRNRVVRKPYSTKKIKLNFDNAQLFGGWDENKLNDYGCSILRRNGLYYVAIMDKQHKKLLGKEMPCDGDCYERMVYKYFKDITTMVPKCSTQLKEVHQHFQQNKSSESIVISGPQFKKPLTISKEVYELNNKTCNGKKKFQVDYLKQTGDKEGYTDAVGKWIKFCKEFLSCAEFNLTVQQHHQV